MPHDIGQTLSVSKLVLVTVSVSLLICQWDLKRQVNNYIIMSYRDVIIVTNAATFKTNKAYIIVQLTK